MKIDISDVKAVLEGSTIIENIDMSANGNELIGIIGPNGSGKSTLLKCIYRTLKPAAGAIMLDNTLLSDIPVKDSAKKSPLSRNTTSITLNFQLRKSY